MGPIPGPANRRSAASFSRRYCLIDACSGSTKLPRIPCYNSVRAIHAFFIGVSRGSRIVNLSLRDSPLMQLVTLASMGGKSVGSRLENPCVGGSIPPRATKNMPHATPTHASGRCRFWKCAVLVSGLSPVLALRLEGPSKRPNVHHIAPIALILRRNAQRRGSPVDSQISIFMHAQSHLRRSPPAK